MVGSSRRDPRGEPRFRLRSSRARLLVSGDRVPQSPARAQGHRHVQRQCLARFLENSSLPRASVRSYRTSPETEMTCQAPRQERTSRSHSAWEARPSRCSGVLPPPGVRTLAPEFDDDTVVVVGVQVTPAVSPGWKYRRERRIERLRNFEQSPSWRPRIPTWRGPCSSACGLTSKPRRCRRNGACSSFCTPRGCPSVTRTIRPHGPRESQAIVRGAGRARPICVAVVAQAMKEVGDRSRPRLERVHRPYLGHPFAVRLLALGQPRMHTARCCLGGLAGRVAGRQAAWRCPCRRSSESTGDRCPRQCHPGYHCDFSTCRDAKVDRNQAFARPSVTSRD
jgi:hypothetical protein